MRLSTSIKFIFLIASLLCGPIGCIGTIISTTTDVAIAVGKVPFKVGAAGIDLASDDDDENPEDEDEQFEDEQFEDEQFEDEQFEDEQFEDENNDLNE